MFLGQTLAKGICDQFIEIEWFFSLLAIAPQHTDSINHAIKIFSDFKSKSFTTHHISLAFH